MRVGLSTCGKRISEDLFHAYRNAGITDMEIENGTQNCNDLNYHLLHTWSKHYGVKLWSYHLPFEPSEEICTSKIELRAKTMNLFTELIKKGSEIGIDKFVIHPSSEPIKDEDRRVQMNCAKENLAELAEIAGKCGAVLAVEDLPRTCLGKNSDEILELISAHPSLRVCFDTNHLLKEDIPTFIRKVGNKIITIHVSDFDFMNERHWLPGEGDIDWQDVICALQEVGYSGPWLYEIGIKAPTTIVRRDLRLVDFAENAKALFAKKNPKILGRRKENLGMWGVIEHE